MADARLIEALPALEAGTDADLLAQALDNCARCYRNLLHKAIVFTPLSILSHFLSHKEDPMSQAITYLSAGTAIRAELFAPAGASRGAAVVAHGSDGLTDHLAGPWGTMMREHAEGLAKAGYHTLLPYYFDKTGTPPGRAALQTMGIHLHEWQDALGAAVDHVAALSGAGASRVALVGFSLGGHLSVRLRDRVAVVVEFFAPYGVGLGTVSHPAPRVQIHHGDNDAAVDVANADRIADWLGREGVAVDVHRYAGAGHGFAGPDPANQAARKLSRERAANFVASYI